ncbi:MAG: hypothetical protein VZR73_11975 [Acutalibacteraceae bacterium]|nr:hypothetical protein [Acutalibacteraceae bacterium]
MITYRSLKARLTAILKETFPGYKVHFDNVEKSDAPYFYVEMTPLKNRAFDGDGIYHDRSIDIDIQLVLAEDSYGRVDRIALYDDSLELDKAIRPVLQIEDRAITVLDSDIKVHDDILHYVFSLSFTDAEMEQVEYELMKELELNINKEE